jgi:hypothetical protein
VINYAEPITIDETRRFALMQVNGTLITNNTQEANPVTMNWNLVIELQPEIRSGPNVWGLFTRELTEKK